MTRDEAKKVKCEFVNMSQHYNGHEITDMWNMMVDQLFDSMDPVLQYFMELKEMPTPIRNMTVRAEAPFPMPKKIQNSVCGVELYTDSFKEILKQNSEYMGLKTLYYQKTI